MKHYTRIMVAAAVAVAGVTGCSNDLNRNAAPVELVATNSQNLHVIDLEGGTRCNETIATVNLQAFLKNASQISDQTFNQVRINRYQVSYVRTDGGKIVPATFVRSIDNLLTPGGAPTALSDFQAFEVDAINHARAVPAACPGHRRARPGDGAAGRFDGWDPDDFRRDARRKSSGSHPSK